MKAVAWHPAAEHEMDVALGASPDAEEFREALSVALDDVASGLVTPALVEGTPCRECGLPRPYPYSFVYLETADTIYVVALPHHKRKLNYWLNRVPKA